MKEKKLNRDERIELEKDLVEMSALWNMKKSDLLHKALEQREEIKRLKDELKIQEFLMRDIAYGFGNQGMVR
jgi:hypothetical protein